MDIKTLFAATALTAATATAGFANVPNCPGGLSANNTCLSSEEVDVDNQAAEGPGRGADTNAMPMTDDMGTGQADGGSSVAGMTDLETTNDPLDGDDSLDTNDG
ncbi:hypothetical protein [Pseudaestuariivita sp.]|uniref:hypothetical protein n=1 Tax=Pseudaestuariivita sp. TaxID=2211669 RepID=UPI00405A1A93